MNYMTEIKLFYDWLETHPLSPASIALWHALMFIANRSGWREELRISATLLEMRTNMPRTTIFRQREILKAAGRITFNSQGGRAACIYRIIALESQFVCRSGTQSGTQTGGETAVVSQVVSHSGTLYRLNRDKDSTDIPENRIAERKNSAKKREQTLDTEKFLSTLDASWRELMAAWLEYKRTRRESYHSELGAKKCLTMLRNLSGNDAVIAAAIIDRSVANNWAGLFPLPANLPATRGQPSGRGQHIGQIKHPASDEHERRLLAKFDEDEHK